LKKIAGEFGVSERQCSASKSIPLASASFPGCRLVSQTEHGFATDPNAPTYQRREWMLMKKDFNEALKLCNIAMSTKECLPTKSYEVQKIVKMLVESPKPEKYDPFDRNKRNVKMTRESALRNRAEIQTSLGRSSKQIYG
jgi:hypothetical protein